MLIRLKKKHAYSHPHRHPSASRSKDIALTFAGKRTKHLDDETVILEIEIYISLPAVSLVDVTEYSEFPDEEEILFDLRATCTTTSVIYTMKLKEFRM
jgi:hypothetical protein